MGGGQPCHAQNISALDLGLLVPPSLKNGLVSLNDSLQQFVVLPYTGSLLRSQSLHLLWADGLGQLVSVKAHEDAMSVGLSAMAFALASWIMRPADRGKLVRSAACVSVLVEEAAPCTEIGAYV